MKERLLQLVNHLPKVKQQIIRMAYHQNNKNTGRNNRPYQNEWSSGYQTQQQSSTWNQESHQQYYQQQDTSQQQYHQNPVARQAHHSSGQPKQQQQNYNQYQNQQSYQQQPPQNNRYQQQQQQQLNYPQHQQQRNFHQRLPNTNQQQQRSGSNFSNNNNCRNINYNEQGQENQTTSARPSQQSVSPLNDFGDMGAAVRQYVEVDNTKKSNANNQCHSNDTMANRQQIDDNNVYRKQHGLTVWDDYGGGRENIPDPFQRFEHFQGLSKTQLDAFYQAGFQAPTPIQAQTWPIALRERDVVSIAKTGSGKTLAFLLPAYKKIGQMASRGNQQINALVLAPTRELATQIQEEANKFGSIAGFYSACAYGGAPKRDQLRAMNAGISVLVATPGRLNDFIESNQVNLSSVFYLVLDEADRMLDMGFEPQIRSIIRRLPRKRQTLMFSATWPEEVRRLANDFLHQPIHIRLGNTESGLQANESIRQHLISLQSGEDKDRELVSLLRSKFHRTRELVLIFVARKNSCDFVANMLNRCGIQASAMHGDKTQSYREKTLQDFKDGVRPIMVATDVASRGIDVKGISAVINYDLANSSEDYVHRIGRTGRAGMDGESYTFLTHSNEDIWKAMGIVEIMEKNSQPVPPEIQQMIDRLRQRQQQNKERRNAENEQYQIVLLVAEKPSVAKMIAEYLSGGRFRTRKGQSRANQIFEFFRWFSPAQQKCKLMVTSVVGHIFGLNFENSKVRDLSELFNSKVKKQVEDTTKKLRIVEHLQELGAESDYLFLWLDCDREGENIGFEVISLTQQFVHYDNVYRAKFSALTKSELINAYENPVRPDRYAAMSVDARQELDLKIGVAFSKLMTRAYLNMAKEKFRLKDQKVVSYGPCQTPTLWFCVQRHKEIKNFRPSKFYIVSVTVNVQGQRVELEWEQDKVTNPREMSEMESAVRSARNVRVTEIREERKTMKKPLGLNTVTLLKACSKGLGISPNSAMSAAEHLYTSGYISYPRTETSIYPPSFDLISALEEQARHPNWGRVATNLLHSGRINRPEQGFDVGDHPPITPIRTATRDEITKNIEWRIYDYVTRHFIGSLHDDMEYTEKKLVVDVNGYRFHYTWHEILDRGFTFAMPWKLKSLQLNETTLPESVLREGHTLNIMSFDKSEEFTKPPDYLQESELIALMDKHGIGTDASIPQHITNIQNRHYVDVCGPGENGERGQIIKPYKFFGKQGGRGGKQGNQQQQQRPASRHMVPRGFGLAFLACFEELDMELCEPKIRAYMEEQVSKIATGETEKNEVVSGNLKLFCEKFIHFRDQMERVDRFFAPKNQPSEQSNNFNRGGSSSRGGSGRGGGDGRGRGRGGRGFQSNNFHSSSNSNNSNYFQRNQHSHHQQHQQNQYDSNEDFNRYQNQNNSNWQQGNRRGGNNQSCNSRGGFSDRGAHRGGGGTHNRGSYHGTNNNNFGRGRGGMTQGDRNNDRRQFGRGRGGTAANLGQKRGSTTAGNTDTPKRQHHSY